MYVCTHVTVHKYVHIQLCTYVRRYTFTALKYVQNIVIHIYTQELLLLQLELCTYVALGGIKKYQFQYIRTYIANMILLYHGILSLKVIIWH